MLATASSCSKSYDDGPLKGRVETIDKRITSLESRIKSYNEQLATLEQLIKPGRYLKSLREIRQENKLVAYELTMSDEVVFVLPLGQKGKAGKGITMGIQQDPFDGKYYWTLDNAWLMNVGNRVPVYATDNTEGIAGATPKLKIENNIWYVQIKAGEWTRLDYPARGPYGDPGDETIGIFESINANGDDGTYELKLVDGTVLKIPGRAKVKIIFSNNPATMSPLVNRHIGYPSG